MAEDEPAVYKHVQVLMIAEQLEMDGLRRLAMRKFDEQIRNNPKVEHLTGCIEVAYHFPSPHCHGLRPVVAAVMKQHLERTPHADAVEDAVEDTIRMCEDLATDINAFN